MAKAKSASKAKSKKTVGRSAKSAAPAKAKPRAKAKPKAQAKNKAVTRPKTLPKIAPQATAAKSAASAKGDATTSAQTLQRLSAKYPTLTPAELDAFRTLYSVSQCDEIGRRTKATEVRDEAARWAIIIDGALRAYPGALAGYTPKRFAFFLSQATALANIIAEEDGHKSTNGGVKSDVERERASAQTFREDVIDRMHTFAGGREIERADLATAIGDASNNDGLVRSLRSLAHLETEWIERIDPASKVLVESAGLTAEDATQLRAFASKLSSKNVDAALQGPRRAQDTPEMNRLEGRVVLEMKEVRRIFHAVNAKNSVVPRLETKGPLKYYLGTHAKKAAPLPPPDDNEGEGDGQVAEAPPAVAEVHHDAN